MRSAILILSLLLVLGGVFFLVVLRDRPAMYADEAATRAATQPTSVPIVPATIATLDPDAAIVGSTANAHFDVLDPTTGRKVKEYSFARLDPRKNENVDVTLPRAWFYNEDGSTITLEGTVGTISYSQNGRRGDTSNAGNATPQSGTLRDVTIRMFEGAADAGDPPTLVCRVPAVQFDSIDNRISTADGNVDGKLVLAEQMPVTVRGRDYDFDGRGMTMRWNDRDGRLEQLDIRHGDRLVIRNAGAFDGGNAPVPAPAAAAAAMPVDVPLAGLASPANLLDGLLLAEAPATRHAPTPGTRPSKVPVMYRAEFLHDVRVFRGDAPIATADTLDAVLPIGEEKTHANTPSRPPNFDKNSKREAATRPSTRRAASSKPTREPKPKPATAATALTANVAVDTNATPSTTMPATTRAASGEAIEIRWTGPLTVRPIERRKNEREPAKSVQFVGSPARVVQGTSTIEGRLIYAEPDTGLARVEPGGDIKGITLTFGDDASPVALAQRVARGPRGGRRPHRGRRHADDRRVADDAPERPRGLSVDDDARDDARRAAHDDQLAKADGNAARHARRRARRAAVARAGHPAGGRRRECAGVSDERSNAAVRLRRAWRRCKPDDDAGPSRWRCVDSRLA